MLNDLEEDEYYCYECNWTGPKHEFKDALTMNVLFCCDECYYKKFCHSYKM